LAIAEFPTLNKMYQTKRPLRIPNTLQSEDWAFHEHIKSIQSWMGVPILFGDEPVAFLMVDKIEPDFYQAQHEKWLVAFANQATLALKHAQLFTEVQRRVTELEALSSVSAALRSSGTVPHILQAVLQAMVEILSATVGVAFLLNDEETAVVSQASYPPNFYPPGIAYLLGEGITGHVAKTGKLHVTATINEDVLHQFKPEEPEEIQQLRSTIALPLISEESILGVIHLGLDKLHEFAEDEIRTLQAMNNIVANGLQRIQIMQTLEARVASRTLDLKMANDRLQDLDKLKTKFIADVSHELRTPVANLGIYINLLENGKPEKQAHYISILQQQVNRLTNLVEATLGLSQLEMGQHNQTFSPIALNAIIDEIILDHQPRADAFGIMLTRSLQPDLPLVLGNKTQLVQLITNLLTNGIHYNEKKGKIVVETFVADEKNICLRFIDDGVGIDEQELPHLFDRFYRGQRTGQSNIPGTGLGLSIVREIVDLHQGEIAVESKISEGTTFSVLLPIYQADEPISDVKEMI
jgi:signal transduction histidine kinase